MDIFVLNIKGDELVLLRDWLKKSNNKWVVECCKNVENE